MEYKGIIMLYEGSLPWQRHPKLRYNVEAGEKRGLFPEAGKERPHCHGSLGWEIDYDSCGSQFLSRDGSCCVLSLNLDLHKT